MVFHALLNLHSGGAAPPEYIALTDAGASDLHTYELLLGAVDNSHG